MYVQSVIVPEREGSLQKRLYKKVSKKVSGVRYDKQGGYILKHILRRVGVHKEERGRGYIDMGVGYDGAPVCISTCSVKITVSSSESSKVPANIGKFSSAISPLTMEKSKACSRFVVIKTGLGDAGFSFNG